MKPDSVEILSLDLPCDRHAPAIVRRALADAGSECGRLGDGLLVASELVTNAVLHSGCATDHRIQVRALVLTDGLLISVHDPGITGQEARPRQSLDAELTPPSAHSTDAQQGPSTGGSRLGGWGLRIVAQLARRWGAERPDGYRVWAELARPS